MNHAKWHEKSDMDFMKVPDKNRSRYSGKLATILRILAAGMKTSSLCATA